MLQNSLLKASPKSFKYFQGSPTFTNFVRRMSLPATSSSYSPRILIIGAAYGGLSTATNLLNLCDGKPQLRCPIPLPEVRAPKITPLITVLDEKDGIFHTMGAPLAHTAKGFVGKAWKKFDDIPALKRPNVRILRGTATGVDIEKKSVTFKNISSQREEVSVGYDYLVVATGSRRVWPIVPRALDKKTYMQDAKEHIESIENTDGSIVVVGGGAVGVEVAAEVKSIFPAKNVTLVHSRAKLLSSEPLPEDFKEKAFHLLRQAGVDVLLNTRVVSDEKMGNDMFKVVFSNGEEMTAGKIIYSTAKHSPRTEFLPQALLDGDGHVKVSNTMGFLSDTTGSPSHFAVGDIAAWSGIKRVGSALIMGQFVATNIVQTLIAAEEENNTHPSLSELPVMPAMMALAIGKEALGYQPPMGMFWGEELMQSQFGTDMGLSACWDHLGIPLIDSNDVCH